MVGLTALFLAVFSALALLTYSPGDYVAPVKVIQNQGGRAGAAWGGLLVDVFGLGAFLVPVAFAWLGARSVASWLRLPVHSWLGAGFLSLVLMTLLSSAWGVSIVSIHSIKGGGYIGQLTFHVLDRYLGTVGAYSLLAFALVAAVQLTFGLTWDNFWRPAMTMADEKCWRLFDVWQAWRQRRALAREARLAGRPTTAPPSRPRKEPRPARRESEPPTAAVPDETPSEAVDRFLDAIVEQVGTGKVADRGTAKGKAPEPGNDTPPPSPPKPVPARQIKAAARAAASGDAVLPPLDLLSVPPAGEAVPVEPEVCRRQAESLITCLNDFGIQGEVQRVVPGPVVTMFEVKPAPGVKISRIVGLSVDLALAMKALAVRIEGPIPGKDTVGVEIPNAKRQTVYFRDILDAEDFRAATSKLTLAIGKDIQGRPHVADLARMPHLLVAGATGSGKSVCINGILLSILYKATPDEVKLLLVDPKRIELSVYNDLPHLVHPVVTETATAKSALDWAVAEMDRRYEAMALLGVRNIAGYNEKLEKLGDNRPEELAALEPMPYLVIVIDELADLMMTAAKEVEVSIVRLAQLARASGIHMVLATQRPSVDVVTGLIKANFPTRIAFQVTSKHDSRTILDAVGAEYLLGRGDMLFKPSGGKTVRMHGAFVSDEETAAVVEFWKSRAAPNYSLDFNEWQKNADNGGGDFGGEGGGDDTASDPVYPQAVEFVMEQGKASISLIQRRFRIGFNRAARFIEQMERDGLLGPQEGSKPRSVIRGKE